MGIKEGESQANETLATHQLWNLFDIFACHFVDQEIKQLPEKNRNIAEGIQRINFGKAFMAFCAGFVGKTISMKDFMKERVKELYEELLKTAVASRRQRSTQQGKRKTSEPAPPLQAAAQLQQERGTKRQKTAPPVPARKCWKIDEDLHAVWLGSGSRSITFVKKGSCLSCKKSSCDHASCARNLAGNKKATFRFSRCAKKTNR